MRALLACMLKDSWGARALAESIGKTIGYTKEEIEAVPEGSNMHACRIVIES